MAVGLTAPQLRLKRGVRLTLQEFQARGRGLRIDRDAPAAEHSTFASARSAERKRLDDRSVIRAGQRLRNRMRVAATAIVLAPFLRTRIAIGCNDES
jgi:hypothetical protein